MALATIPKVLIRCIAKLSFKAITILVIMVALCIFSFAMYLSISNTIKLQKETEIKNVESILAKVQYAIDLSLKNATGPVCSQEFLSEFRKIAFLPDGLNEFLYMPLNTVHCGTTIGKYKNKIPLGEPDARDSKTGFSYWFNRDLAPLGRPGSNGTIIERDNFASIVPYFSTSKDKPSWLQLELIALDNKGTMKYLAGTTGLINKPQISLLFQGKRNIDSLSVTCHSNKIICIITKFDFAKFVNQYTKLILTTLIILFIFSFFISSFIYQWFQRYNAFEARFHRNMLPGSIFTVYQPIMDITSQTIMGCEVLVRFRDIDGKVIEPSRFLDLVVQAGKTLPFTKIVADQAYKDLSEVIPESTQLQVNFNLFPGDAKNPKILEIFSKFQNTADKRFTLAAEIVETEEFKPSDIEKALEILKSAGIKTYIDDFGTGYSSLENMFALPFDGVKLDKSFTIAPPDSLLGRMLIQILNLLRASRRPIVVEGIENQETLDMLSELELAQYAQGYVISRPVSAEEFAKLLHQPSQIISNAA